MGNVRNRGLHLIAGDCMCLAAYTFGFSRDFADEFPNASVIGTDISPIQSNWVPPNIKL